MNKLPITVQINLAPNDYPISKHLLQNQINLFKDHVDEILLTIETKKSKGRFGANWDINAPLMNALIKSLKADNLTVDYINYSSGVKKKIGTFFFGQEAIPEKDYRGGPFYCYFYGLYQAKNNIILHFDSDIFFGGNSQKWIYEAFKFHSNPSIFTTSPLPGPPDPDEKLQNQTILKRRDKYQFELEGFSTRIFTINKSIFIDKKLSLETVNLRNYSKALLKGHSPYKLPEFLIHKFIKKHDYKRIDFLGDGLGLWSLHPPYKTKAFQESIPNILEKIKRFDFSDQQLGNYDIDDSLFDWSAARLDLKNNAWYKRLFK